MDWWALGVLIFEMAAGRPPFEGGGGGDRMPMFRDISKGRFSFPAHFSKDLRDLFKRLLAVSAAARLGSGKGGAAEVKAHPWFRGGGGGAAGSSSPSPVAFDWGALAARTIPAPFVPPSSTTAKWAESVENSGGSLPGVSEGAAAAAEDDEGEQGEGGGNGGGGGGSRGRYESTGAFQDF